MKSYSSYQSFESKGDGGDQHHPQPIFDETSEGEKRELLPSHSVSNREDDKAFLSFVERHKIKSILEQIQLEVLSITAVTSIPAFLIALRRFPLIKEIVKNAFLKIWYFRCEQPPLLTAIEFEAATANTEGAGFTAMLVSFAVVLSTLNATYQGLRYLKTTYSNIHDLKKTLEALQLDASYVSYFSALSTQKLFAIKNLLFEYHHHDKEFVNTMIRLYFDRPTTQASWRWGRKHHHFHDLLKRINAGHQKERIQSIMPIETDWEKKLANLAWYRNALGLYYQPIARLSVMPGVAYMLYTGAQIYGGKVLVFLTLWTNEAPLEQQDNLMLLQIYPWMSASFPVLLFRVSAFSAYFLTRNFLGKQLGDFFYRHIHSRMEHWNQESEKSLYQEFVWNIASSLLLTPAMLYSAYDALQYGNRFAASIQCGSVSAILFSVFYNQYDPKSACTVSNKGNVLAAVVGKSELVNLYPFLIILESFTYLLTLLLLKSKNFKSYFPLDKVKRLLQRFRDMNVNDMFFTKIAVVGSAFSCIPITLYANHLIEQGIKIAFPLDGTGTQYANITDFLHSYCPTANITEELLEDAFFNTPVGNVTFANFTQSIEIISNSTALYTIAPGCPQYLLLDLLWRTFAYVEIDCDPLTVYKTIPFFITCFWLIVGYAGGVTNRISNFTQQVCWAMETIIDFLCPENELADEYETENQDLLSTYTPLPSLEDTSESVKDPSPGFFTSGYYKAKGFFNSSLGPIASPSPQASVPAQP